jgi:hypothetical protein
MTGHSVLLTSIAMYAAVWHRGRQSLGVARFYQRGMGGPVSRAHNFLFRGAIYLPMLAGMLAYTRLAPEEYEGKPYFVLNCGAEITFIAGLAAASSVIAYLAWISWRNRGEGVNSTAQNARDRVHPGEWWVVLAHAAAFGSGYVLGAANASFLLVLAVHHEVQYLYFTYAVARYPGNSYAAGSCGAMKDSYKDGRPLRTEVGHVASFLVWPIIGFAGAVIGGWTELQWLAPLGVGGLFCHYWLDGRIWTPRVRG